MALIFKKSGPFDEVFGCWEIEETEDFFLERLALSAAEREELSRIRGARRLEWLTGRLLLHEISGEKERLKIEKTAAGCPFWPEAENRPISISHSAGKLAAAIVGEERVGIDCQVFTEKIGRVAHKFLGEKELAENEPGIEFFHQIWSAKEAMFKAWGAGGVDFRRHLSVGKIEAGRAVGRLERLDAQMSFDLFFEKLRLGENDFMLARAVENLV